MKALQNFELNSHMSYTILGEKDEGLSLNFFL